MIKRKHGDIISSKHIHDSKNKHDSDFIIIRASTVVSIPPVFASNPREGVLEMFDSMIMRYIPSLGGVVLTHSNLQFLQSKAPLQYDCPYVKCSVAFDATIWSPSVGQRLSGKVILYSPDHISLLVHRTFNVSIPRHHIPTEKCDFQWSSAKNGTGAEDVIMNTGDGDITMTNGEDVTSKDVDVSADGVDNETVGLWVDSGTGKPLGPILEFTVIGLTVANQMLSLIGSLQPDPFSPRHVPPAAVTGKGKEKGGHRLDASRNKEDSDEAEDAAEVDAIIETRSERELSSSDNDNLDSHKLDKTRKKAPSTVESKPKPKRKKRTGDGTEDANQKEKKKKPKT